jgi:sugar phosphate isomerase/epimerase
MLPQTNTHLWALPTISMGWHSSHTLERKIHAAANQGFDGIELCWDDFNKFASAHALSRTDAAALIRDLCKQNKIKIAVWQPFMNFEGSKRPLSERLEEAREWITLARILETDIIQVASNYEIDSAGDEDTIVSELRMLADLGSQHTEHESMIYFAYEALSWGSHVALWETSLHIVNLVDRPNFGLCLDTYHVLARIWADPRSLSGKLPGADFALRASLYRFLETCPVDRIFYMQLSDAEKLDPPLLPGHPAFEADKDPSILWCLYGRLFPFESEKGAYLPMPDILRVWLREKEWHGWVSLETFHREEKQESVGPEVWAERGKRSLARIQECLDGH